MRKGKMKKSIVSDGNDAVCNSCGGIWNECKSKEFK